MFGVAAGAYISFFVAVFEKFAPVNKRQDNLSGQILRVAIGR